MGTLITTFKDKKFVNYGVNQGDWETTLNGTLEVTGLSTFKADVSLLDNDKLKIGGTSASAGDLQIYHDGSNSYIEGGMLGSSSGDLIIRNKDDGRDLVFQGDNGDGDGSQTTYFLLDNSIANTGNPDVYTRFPDHSRLTFGDSANTNSLDFEIYHEGGGASYIKNGAHYLNIESKGGLIFENDTSGDITIEQKRNDGEIDFKCDNGSNGTQSYLKLNGSDVSVNILTQKVMMSNLPTSDPSVAGQLWNSSGTLKVSAG
tara:strand:- start:123 stop:899 length:777 start_codon:yes stop_codon:yes gene_type:complete